MRKDAQGGYVTAELAASLPVLIALLLAGMFAVSAVTTKVRCVDAAREAALAQARGEDGEGAARQQLPDGATVAISSDHDTVTARVETDVHPDAVLLPQMTVSGVATAAVEPTVEHTREAP